jgi:hypothetical protein
MEDFVTAAAFSISNVSPHRYTPWLFQHSNILSMDNNSEPLERDKLINKLNYIHFNDGHIFFLLSQRATGAQILIRANPQHCASGVLTSRLQPADAAVDLKNYVLDHLMIDDGLTTILSPVQTVSLDGYNLKTRLPDVSRVQALRKTKRYSCDDVNCRIIQGDFLAYGKMIDFSTGGLGISLGENAAIETFNQTKSVLINIDRKGVLLYSGLCRCIDNRRNDYDNKLVFIPLQNQFPLFPKRELRNDRQHAGHSFSACFYHPFFNSYIERDIFDISVAGFSIRSSITEDLLLPGMWIPDIHIAYAGYVKIKCSAKVVYREIDPEINIVKYGLAVADMSLEAYTRLIQILGVSSTARVGITTDVEMDALWEFFFDTGFIDSEAYENIQNRRKDFKEFYQALYRNNQDIARHILYKTNGRVYGHVAMIHAYEPSWLIHHFAARDTNNRLQTLTFLKHVIQYLAPYQRLHDAGTNHYMTYYQQDNDINERLFDHFTRQLNDSKKCSVDGFAAMLFKKSSTKKLPEGWMIRECTLRDMMVLKEFYEPASGGLLLSALGLDVPSECLKKSFAGAGFLREYRTYCLCYESRQLAFFVMNQSDIKLNLSELINGITIIIIEPDILSWAMLAQAVNCLGVFYSEDTIPLMIYPSHFLPLQNIKIEKQYALWILHAKATDEWLACVNRLISIPSGRR